VLRENEDALVISDELINACQSAANAWQKVNELRRKQASTLPQDGRSEVGVDDPTTDLGDVPPFLDRRKSRTA
jgi:hypothetical protein